MTVSGGPAVSYERGTPVLTRWAAWDSFLLESASYVTKSAAHDALKFILWCKMTVDARVVVHRLDVYMHRGY
jgi:hypothetical protein